MFLTSFYLFLFLFAQLLYELISINAFGPLPTVVHSSEMIDPNKVLMHVANIFYQRKWKNILSYNIIVLTQGIISTWRRTSQTSSRGVFWELMKPENLNYFDSGKLPKNLSLMFRITQRIVVNLELFRQASDVVWRNRKNGMNALRLNQHVMY